MRRSLVVGALAAAVTMAVPTPPPVAGSPLVLEGPGVRLVAPSLVGAGARLKSAGSGVAKASDVTLGQALTGEVTLKSARGDIQLKPGLWNAIETVPEPGSGAGLVAALGALAVLWRRARPATGHPRDRPSLPGPCPPR